MKTAVLVYGNQLFLNHPGLTSKDDPVIMIEAYSICTAYRYHKHKLILVLSAMREYRDQLREKGFTVQYVELAPGTDFTKNLVQIIKAEGITSLKVVSPEDRGAAEKLRDLTNLHKLQLEEFENPNFLTPRALALEWFATNKNPLMEYFYRWQRRRLNILIENDKPVGGAWNFDSENRKPLPKTGVTIPALPFSKPSTHVKEVSKVIDTLFPTNPGNTQDFKLPVTRAGARQWLNTFIDERLPQFGTYEDAMAKDESFLFHSLLTPFLNIGLLTPDEPVKAALDAYKQGTAPLNCVEGFIRQIVGWREYMRGVYWYKEDLMDANFFGFTRELEDWWYTRDYQKQNLPPPLRQALDTVHTYGYNHHIERLMVLGNWFLLNEYNPKSVFRWFQSMYLDAYEWVMLPNVQGMSQYADGGFVATKPYIAGGNYLQKMGRWWANADEAKASDYTRKYWEFLKRNGNKLKNNPRMGIALKQAEKHVAFKKEQSTSDTRLMIDKLN